MSIPFFDHPILNSPYQPPSRHWELDDTGQPTQRVEPTRRPAKFVTPIPKPKKRGSKKKGPANEEMLFDEVGADISTEELNYDLTQTINSLRHQVDGWRALENPTDWKVTTVTLRTRKAAIDEVVEVFRKKCDVKDETKNRALVQQPCGTPIFQALGERSKSSSGLGFFRNARHEACFHPPRT